MAVPDVTLAEDNYLKKAFLIGSGGAWTLDVSYLEYVDTGILDIYVDDVLIDSVDTYGPKLAMNAVAVDLSLNPGLHEVKLAGRSSEREIVSGSMGHWVEVDGVVLRANGATAGTPPPSSVTRISDLALSPRGASLDIDAGSEGIVWIAYYANPWWKTYVDGQEAEVLTINGVFPGCRVPGGRHRVEFIYNYPSPMNLFSLVPI